MDLLFVYGSLKQGFVNEHVNTGQRIDGRYRTCIPYPMFLLGEGEVPCVVAAPGSGHCVVGEIYRVGADDLHRMDRLERVGELDGYERIIVDLERFDVEPAQCLSAFVYVKREHAIGPGEPRIGPLTEYRHEHATNFRWKGAE